AFPSLKDNIISYGSCQFPTLGFVVDRFRRVKGFVPEPFWGIKVVHKKDAINVTFNWDRNRLFDRMVVTILLERCLQARTATVTSVLKKPTKKWYPSRRSPRARRLTKQETAPPYHRRVAETWLP